MKQMNIEIDENLVTEGLKATGFSSVNGLVDYALRELLGQEQVRCHCPFAEDPRCRHRWAHPEVAGVCRSGQEKSGEGALSAPIPRQE